MASKKVISAKKGKSIKDEIYSNFEPGPEFEIFNRLKYSLDNSKISYKDNIYVSGSAQDFFLELPTGGTVTLEIKSFEPTIKNIQYVQSLANSYHKVTGADYSFVVVPNIVSSDINKGVITVNDAEKIIKNPFILVKKRKRNITPKITDEEYTKCIFVAIPFKAKYSDTFAVGIEPACTANKFFCKRVDNEKFTGDIVQKIKKLIENSVGAIVDISESRPNVIFELGFSLGMDKKVIQICSTPLDQMEFDIRNDNTIHYKIGQCTQLCAKLVDYVPEIFP